MARPSNPLLDKLRKEADEYPEHFWAREAEKVNWFKKWTRIFTWNPPVFRWCEGGITNLSYNCVDRHVQAGLGDHPALISENERQERVVYSYSQLLSKVKTVASALRGVGVKKGDRIAIYMPTMPEAVMAMLAAARIGGIHIVIFAGFGSEALSERIRLAGAKVLLTADVTYRKGKDVSLWPIVQRALSDPGSPIQKTVILNRMSSKLELNKARDLDWNEFIEQGEGHSSDYEPMEANEPVYILATSGTTSKPKLVVHVHGGYQVWLRSTGDWLYGFKPSDVWWAVSDIGWVVGHSYIVYAPLIFGLTSIAYEGAIDQPGPETFYGIVQRNGVTSTFVAPTAVRLLMKYGTNVSRTFDLSKVDRIFCAGEALNPPAWEWLQKEVFHDRIPVTDHMWQTETGGPIIGNPYGLGLLPIKPGSATAPLPGVSLEIRTMEGKPCASGEKGIVVLTRPFPGLTPTIWGDPERYQNEYWAKIPGVYFTGDAAYLDEDGYVWFCGRADEIMKIAGHRIGTVEVESALLRHPAVAEAGVTGRADELRGEVISAFVALRHGYEPSEKLRKELIETVRQLVGPVAVMGEVNFVAMLPKTRSGKIMRRVIKAVVLGREPGDISTIEDEGSVEEARQAWKMMEMELKSQKL